jgi:hypothetical protein
MFEILGPKVLNRKKKLSAADRKTRAAAWFAEARAWVVEQAPGCDDDWEPSLEGLAVGLVGSTTSSTIRRSASSSPSPGT